MSEIRRRFGLLRDRRNARHGNPGPAVRGLGNFGRRAIFLVAALTLLIGWGYGLWRIHGDREVSLEASHEQLATLARSMSSQFDAMVSDGVGSALAADRLLNAPGNREGAEEILASMLTGGPYVRSLFLLRDQELIVANLPGESLAREDMPWLTELGGSQADTWVGRVQIRQPGDELLLPIARRIPGAVGSPRWAGAMLRISDLAAVYAGLLGSHAAVALVHDSGRLVTQIPREAVATINLDLSQSSIFRLYSSMQKSPMTMVVGPHPATGELRQFAASPLSGLPVFATGGRNVADALGAWRARTAASLVFMVISTLIVCALAVALQRELVRRIAQLQRSEERFQLAAAGANDGLFEWESGSGQVYLTPRALELLHLPEGTGLMSYGGAGALVAPEDLERVTAAFRAHIREHLRLDVEAQLLVAGTYRWFRIRGQAEWSSDGAVRRLAGAIGDIDDAVRAQAVVAEARHAELVAKESLARELLAAQEQERRRLASELHDGIGQNLSLLRNRIVMMQRTGLPAMAESHARTLLDLTTESIEDLRSVAQNLRPLHLEELGIVTALRTLVEKVEDSSELLVHSRLEDIDDVIRGNAATHVYRIAQEAINNVLRHSHARNLWLEAVRDVDCVLVRIRDDGHGFVAPHGAVAGLGMLSIRERCNILQATLMIDSDPQSGTRIHIRIPLEVGDGIAEEEEAGDVTTGARAGQEARRRA